MPALSLQVPPMSARSIGLAALPIAADGSEEYVTVTRMRLTDAVRAADVLSLSTFSRTPKFEALIWAGVQVVPQRSLALP